MRLYPIALAAAIGMLACAFDVPSTTAAQTPGNESGAFTPGVMNRMYCIAVTDEARALLNDNWFQVGSMSISAEEFPVYCEAVP